ncbi:hypothetical protein [Saccharomonospora sp.]|uniref:hypothetical protein n=1 Tax=Saccharomonospora sp. TaxID=33913 RepID=UPI00262F80B4|nr:hypothetical protein [Saccharomonospora sp.]
MSRAQPCRPMEKWPVGRRGKQRVKVIECLFQILSIIAVGTAFLESERQVQPVVGVVVAVQRRSEMIHGCVDIGWITLQAVAFE